MEPIEEDVMRALEIYGRAKQPVTETDVLVWFKGQYPAMDIRKALRTLEDDRRVVARSETYWSPVR